MPIYSFFYANNEWTIPPTVNSIIVECWGGGGAGGSATGKGVSTRAMGGGGAGGAYARKTLSVSPGEVYTVKVGAATTASGQNGNPSWFGSPSTVYAEGGGGGQNAIAGTDTKYGTGSLGSSANSIGDVVKRGGNGGISHLNVKLYRPNKGDKNFSNGPGGGAGGELGNGGDSIVSSGRRPNEILTDPNKRQVYWANTSSIDFLRESRAGFGSGKHSGGGGQVTEDWWHGLFFDGGSNITGNDGYNYGGGGAGGIKTRISFGTSEGGKGAQGLVKVTWELNPICICFYTSGSNCCPPQIGCTAYGDPGFTTIAEPGYYYDGTKCWIINDSGLIAATGSCGETTTTSTTTTTTTEIPTTFYTATKYSCPDCSSVGGVTVYSSTPLNAGTYYSIVDGFTYLISGPTSGPSYDVDLTGASSGASCFSLCIT